MHALAYSCRTAEPFAIILPCFAGFCHRFRLPKETVSASPHGIIRHDCLARKTSFFRFAGLDLKLLASSVPLLGRNHSLSSRPTHRNLSSTRAFGRAASRSRALTFAIYRPAQGYFSAIIPRGCLKPQRNRSPARLKSSCASLGWIAIRTYLLSTTRSKDESGSGLVIEC